MQATVLGLQTHSFHALLACQPLELLSELSGEE